MNRVVVESPYAGDTERNLKYLRACLRDCVLRGESPYASHSILTQPGVLRDHVSEERELGINAGFAWREVAHLTAVYTDLGMSSGMERGIAHAKRIGQEVVYRRLGVGWEEDLL